MILKFKRKQFFLKYIYLKITFQRNKKNLLGQNKAPLRNYLIKEVVWYTSSSLGPLNVPTNSLCVRTDGYALNPYVINSPYGPSSFKHKTPKATLTTPRVDLSFLKRCAKERISRNILRRSFLHRALSTNHQIVSVSGWTASEASFYAQFFLINEGKIMIRRRRRRSWKKEQTEPLYISSWHTLQQC